VQVIFVEKPQLKKISFLNYKHLHLFHTDKALKTTVENQALGSLHGGSLEIALTVSLTLIYLRN